MNNENTVDERTLKIVELARSGIGGEKQAAQRILRRICADQGLSYEDLINDVSEKCSEHMIKTGRLTKNEVRVVAQVVYKFATSKEHSDLSIIRSRRNGYVKGFIAVCTPAQAVEAQYAVKIFLRAYRAEVKRIAKDIQIAFVMKHGLYPQYETAVSDQELTEEDREQLRRAQLVSFDMAGVSVHKAIEG